MNIVRILTRPNVGGPMLQAVQLWHAMRARGVRTLLVVGQCRRGETPVDLQTSGIPILHWTQLAPGCEGILTLPALGNAWPWLGDRRALSQVREILLQTKPQVVHTHTSKAGWLGRKAAFAAAVPIVAHTFHGHVLRDYFGPVRSRLLARLERSLARTTDLLFAVSQSCADELAALGIADRARVSIVPPAVARSPAVDRAAARARMGVPNDAFLLACIGRLVPVKRVEHFLACVRALPNTQGHIYGDGPRLHALRALAKDLPQVRFHGVDHAVRATLSAHDVLVLPSIREGLPLVAVEAFEAGVPVVGYDVPGTGDALRLGGGLLVPESAGPLGLAAMVTRLRHDPELRARCVAAGLAARNQFEPTSVAAQLIDAYQAASAQRSG